MRTARDVDALRSWNDEWSGLVVAVLGLGKTGFSVADTLVELGAFVTVVTATADPERADLLEVIGARLIIVAAALDVADGPVDIALDNRAFDDRSFDTRALAIAALDGIAPDLVVVSPGIAPSNPMVRWCHDAGVPVWGDVELAWRLRDKQQPTPEWIAVTGTNGKTTTVQLATAMIAADDKRVVACGNVGVPVLDAIRDPIGFEILVVELSSFQLHYLDSMSAHTSVCLNLAVDHLDWHGSLAAYSAAKAKVYERTRVACVYNLSDDATLLMVEKAEVIDGCRAVGFGLGTPGPSDVGLVDDILCDRAFLDTRHSTALELTTLDRLEAVGLGSPHMVSNVLAAATLARSVGVAPDAIRRAIDAFRLDHHRTEEVGSARGVRFVDDSKATNPHAADASLASFESVVWIVGGLLKGAELGPLISRHAARVRAAVVIGRDREPVLAEFARHAPEVPVFEVASTDTDSVMPIAVALATGAAESGDVVLLAPAAASMDQFDDYGDRGNRFTIAVEELLGDRDYDDEHPAPSATSGD